MYYASPEWRIFRKYFKTIDKSLIKYELTLAENEVNFEILLAKE